LAQFDVHRNVGKQRETIPFVVIVQSSLFDDYRRRVIVPLVRKTAVGNFAHGNLNPVFKVEGVSVILHPLEIVSIPIEQLGDLVESLSQDGHRIMTALDELLTQAWK
jgi:toxin CcdB